MKLADISKNYPIELLGSATGNYLQFNEKKEDWSVVHLNCIQRFFRWIGLAYGSTKLTFIAGKMSLEAGVSPVLLNKIHQVWQSTYPLIRNPLKSERCSFVLPGGHLLGGDIKPEYMKIGKTTVGLIQAENDNFSHQLNFKLGRKGVPLDLNVKAFINELNAIHLKGIQEVSIQFDPCIPSHAFNTAFIKVLSSLEKYVHENPGCFDQIVLPFSQMDDNDMMKAIDLWRGMEHPHARFFEF